MQEKKNVNEFSTTELKALILDRVDSIDSLNEEIKACRTELKYRNWKEKNEG